MTEHEAKLQKAGQFLEHGKYLHAIQIYKSLLQDPQTKRKAVIKLVEIYDGQNHYEAAVNTFEFYFESEPDDENMRAFYAQFLIKYEQYNEAVQTLSLVSSKNQPEKNFLIGTINYHLGEYEIAIINFKEFIRHNKNSVFNVDANLSLARCFVELNDYEKALEYLKLCEEIESNNFNVLKTLAEVYFEKEMFYHANEKIQKAITIFPIDLDLFQLSAKIFLKLNEPDIALKELNFYLENTKPTAESYALKGLIFQKKNDFEEAIIYFEKALELNPADEIATKGKHACIKYQKSLGD